MKLINHFDHFLVEKVNLNPTRMDLLDTRTTAITNFLKRDEIFRPLLKTTIPQGSFAQRTIIRPRADGTFDADVLIHLDPVPDWEWCEYVGKLYTALGRSPVYQDMRHRRTRCVYIDYADEFHVDLVPYVEIDGRGYITNRKTDSSEFTDPKGFTGWLKDQNRVAGGNLIKVVRLFKHMRDITWGFSVKSVILTTLIGERVSAVAEMLDAGCYADVPSTLRKVAADLDDYLQANPLLPAIVDPGGTQDRFDERWDQTGYTTFRAKVNALRVKVDEAFYAADRDTSLAAWQAIFGAGFVAPPTSTTSSSRNGLIVVRGKSLVPTERFLDKDFGIPFALNGHTVTISGQVTAKDGFRPYRLKDNNFQVQKRRSLIFKSRILLSPRPLRGLLEGTKHRYGGRDGRRPARRDPKARSPDHRDHRVRRTPLGRVLRGPRQSLSRTRETRRDHLLTLFGHLTRAPIASARLLPGLDIAAIRHFCEQRVPPHALDQVRVEADVSPTAVTDAECRAPWREDYGPDWTRRGIPRLRYVAKYGSWTLYGATSTSAGTAMT